jgi:DNA-binding response OmpR family regulator
MIDDDPQVSSAVAIRLRAAGYQVFLTADGESGLASAESLRPDVILLDVRLPDMDGFEVARRLRAQPGLMDIPVIFLSVNVQDWAKQAALAVGAQAYLSKPYDHKVMISAIQTALGAKPRRRKSTTFSGDHETMKRILVVDDDEELARAISTRLMAAGHDCATARGAEEGFSRFQAGRFDLVITDVIMPGPDGFSLVEWIRQVSKVPILVITGYEPCREPFLRDFPEIKYLRKPYNAEELLRLVEAQLVDCGTAAVK